MKYVESVILMDKFIFIIELSILKSSRIDLTNSISMLAFNKIKINNISLLYES